MSKIKTTENPKPATAASNHMPQARSTNSAWFRGTKTRVGNSGDSAGTPVVDTTASSAPFHSMKILGHLLKARNVACPLAGLATLIVCILACTSFSPDDTKILYPSFDPQSGALSISVYDRPSRTSRQMFVLSVTSTEATDQKASLLRPQWLPDGKRFLVTWTLERNKGEEDDGIACFAVVSVDGREPVRLLHLDGLKQGASLFYHPLPMIGTQVFANAVSNLVSFDLISGEVRRLPKTQEEYVWFSPATNRLGFFMQESNALTCGLLNPETMGKEWQLRSTNAESEIGDLAFSPQGRRVAFEPDADHNSRSIVTVLEEGKPARELAVPVTENENLKLGNLLFAPRGDRLVAAFELQIEGTNKLSFGFVEIPLDGTAPRRTTLIQNARLSSHLENAGAQLFQIGLSHDGNALAVSSAGVALADREFRAEDCALFLVDLAHATRKVTKIPIPLPSNRARFPE
jgi:hypothetical protein